MRIKSGEVRSVIAAIEPISWLGKPCFISSIVDITERKKAEEALKEEQVRFNQIAATVPGAITMLRIQPDGRYALLYAIQAFEDIFGLALTELFKNVEVIIQRIPPAEIQPILQQLAELTSSLQPAYMEFRYQYPLKGEIWLENRARSMRKADGSVIWYGVTSDITTTFLRTTIGC